MQLFVLLYIEGGSYINEEEDIWEFFTLWVDSRILYTGLVIIPFLDLRNGNEETLLRRRRITLLDIPLCTPFTTFPRKFV